MQTLAARLTFALFLLIAGGCGAEGGGDAGVDGGQADAGPADAAARGDGGPGDSGEPDAGPADSGAADAGPPSREAIASDLVADREALDTAVAAVPMAMRLDGAFAELDVAAAGVDALIGEDGLMTLALSDATGRALADLHTTELLLRVFDRVIDALAGRSEAADVRGRAVAVRATLAMYRDVLARLYRTRLDEGFAGTPTVVEPLPENFSVDANGEPSHFTVAVEGGSESEPANLIVECFPSDPVSVTLEVTLLETGAALGSMVADNTTTIAVSVPTDEVSALFVRVTGVPTGLLPESCNLGVSSRRRLRTAPVAVPFGDSAFDAASVTYFAGVAGVEGELETLAVTADATVLTAARRTQKLYQDLAASLFPSDPLPLPRERVQRLARQQRYVRAMVDAMIAGDALADPMFTALKARLGDGITGLEGMIAVMTTL